MAIGRIHRSSRCGGALRFRRLRRLQSASTPAVPIRFRAMRCRCRYRRRSTTAASRSARTPPCDGIAASVHRNGLTAATARHHGITASRIVRAPSAYLRLPVGFFSPLRHASAVAGRCRPSPKRPLPKSDPQRSRSRREGQARRLSARAALGPSFGIRMGSGADRVDPQRLRPRRVRDGGQPRRRVRRADRRVASRAGDRRGADHRATDCPADGEFSGGGRGLARVADRRRQPEPLRSRRSRQRADRRDCRRHRPRAAAGDARAVGDESGGAAVVPSVAGAGRTPPRCHPGITPTSSVRCLHRSRCT